MGLNWERVSLDEVIPTGRGSLPPPAPAMLILCILLLHQELEKRVFLESSWS